jgi:hypothetical protein
MGSGSSAEVDAHLRKWESAVNDLQTLCGTHRRAIDSDRVVTPPASAFAGSQQQNDGNGSDSNHNNNPASGGSNGKHNDEGNESERSLRRRASSLVSFGGKLPVPLPTGQDGGVVPHLTPRGSTANVIAPHESSNAMFADSTPSKKDSSHNASMKHHSRQQVLELRKKRNAVFQSYECPEGVDFDNVEGALNCNHFAAVALALSSLLGGGKDNADRRTRVTVEDIFFAAQVPLHMLHAPPPPLTVMGDIIREFMDVDNRFKDQYNIEALHLDIAPTLGQVELGANDVGDRQFRVQLPDFRKQITHDIEEESDVIRVVNYDPFVLEQGLMVESDDGTVTQSASQSFNANAFGLNPAAASKYQPKNDGAYAVLTDARNAVQPMVTLTEGVMSDTLFARIKEVPAGQLFKAMASHTGAPRAKGYIRISKRNAKTGIATTASEESAAATAAARLVDDVQLFFTPELCSGKVLGTNVDGCHAGAIAPFIAPHIVACAWAMHLVCGIRPNTHGHGKGLPVSDIIRTLRLPAGVVVNTSDLALDQVYLYFQEYLKRKLMDGNITLGFYPVLTKISREDAVPTISVFDLESILIDVKSGNEDPEQPQNVMLIQYNADVAHNVLGIASLSQWCVLVGYDDDTQTARLIDANAKTFSQSWTCPLDRLHKAMTGYGYLMVARPRESNNNNNNTTTSSRSSTPSTATNPFGIGSLRHIASTVQHRLDLVKEQQQQTGNLFEPTAIPARLRTFSYPDRPFALTTMSLAVLQLTGVNTTLEDLIHRLPYDVNSILNKRLPLECVKICLDRVLTSMGFEGQTEVKVHHFDRHTTGKLTFPIKQFTALLNTHVPSDSNDNDPAMQNHTMIVSFDRSQIQVHGTSNPFGSTAIVVSFHEEESTVTLMDANPSVYLRMWTAPLETLHRAMQNLPGDGHRLNGAVILTKSAAAPATGAAPKPASRVFDLSVAPVQNIFHVSPSPQVQGLSLAFAQLGYFFTPEEIFYEAYLKTVSDQRRRGSQAFAWRDVEVSLAIVNKKIDARLMTLVSKKFIESRKLTGLTVEQVDDIDIEELGKVLTEATNSKDTVLMVNYNTQNVHGLSNMGSSVALVQSYDEPTEMITLVDAEYTLFGWTWKANLAQLIEAADLDNEGSSPYGLVRITRGSGAPAAKTNTEYQGAFSSAPEEAAESSATEHPADGGEHKPKVRGSTTFVEQ